MVTRIILIRHGATNFNLQKRYSGFIDVSLNQLGKKQARNLCRALEGENIDRVYCSDRKRAIQTARIVFKGRQIKKVRDLREIHFGVFEGLKHCQLLKKHPKAYRQWLDNPFKAKIPKGEDLRGFKKRVLAGLNKIISENHGKTVAVVSHGGAISMIINSILKFENFWQAIPSSASLSIIEYRNNKPEVRIFNNKPCRQK